MIVDAAVNIPNGWIFTVDTLATLRQLAMSSQQTLSPAFIRALIKDKGVRFRLSCLRSFTHAHPFF